MKVIYKITPCPKPRMTRRDKWAKRPSVMKYREFKDCVREAKVHLPPFGAHVVFVMPMPESWSAKKKDEMLGQPHVQKPDLDNLIKALGDATYEDDSKIYNISATKTWGRTGSIIIKVS